MNIQALTPKFLRNDIITRSNQTGLNANNASYPNLGPLEKDTVSFGAKAKFVIEPKVITTFEDVFTKNYEDDLPMLRGLSKRLLLAMEAIANDLSDVGLIFDKEYCTKAPVKSRISYLSKFKRSGQKPRDPARASWYLANLHDLSIFSDRILPALENLDYKIATLPGRKKLPDFDVRLSGVPEKSKASLPKYLRDVASFKEQASGYGDIQFRVYDTLADKKGKYPLEIIIVAGKNMAKAKSDESYYVYDITRVLKNELHISKIKDPEIHSPASRIQNNIEIIENQLNANISNRLFSNAKMLDIEHDSSNLLEVGLDEATSRVLPGFVEGIRNKIPLHYKAKIKEVEADKTLSAHQRRVQIELLNQQMEDDMSIITFVAERMKETIAKFGKQAKQ